VGADGHRLQLKKGFFSQNPFSGAHPTSLDGGPGDLTFTPCLPPARLRKRKLPFLTPPTAASAKSDKSKTELTWPTLSGAPVNLANEWLN